ALLRGSSAENGGGRVLIRKKPRFREQDQVADRVLPRATRSPDSPARSRGRGAAPIQRLSGQELRIALPRKSEPFAGRRVQRRPHCPTSKEPPGAPAKGLTNLVSNPT